MQELSSATQPILPQRWPIISLKMQSKSTVKCTSSTALWNMALVCFKIQDRILQLMIMCFVLSWVVQNGSVCLILLLLVIHLHKARTWYRSWLPLKNTSTTHTSFNGWRMYKSIKMFLLSLPLVWPQHMCKFFTSSWHGIFYFTAHSIASMMRKNIINRTSYLLKPLSTPQKKNGQQYKMWRLCMLVLLNNL